jgi:PHD/YefM family antitoxin component YafN of YafNO toxin-antitoxin module
MNINVAELGLNLGNYLAKASQEPVVVEQNGHSMAVLISPELYQKLLIMEEDAAWAERALEAEKSGYAGVDGIGQLLDIAKEKGIAL